MERVEGRLCPAWQGIFGIMYEPDMVIIYHSERQYSRCGQRYRRCRSEAADVFDTTGFFVCRGETGLSRVPIPA